MRSSQDVAKRALCLAALVTRAQAEYQLYPAPGDVPSSEKVIDAAFAVSIEEWLKKDGLWEALSAKEKILFEKPLGTWNKQEIADGQWRAESLVVLLWSLRPGEAMPPYDQLASSSSIMNAVTPPSGSRKFISGAKLRDVDEIARTRDVAELWLWRARTTRIIKEGVRPPKGYTFQKIISMTVEKATKDGLFQPIEGDFPAFHKSYAKLTDEEWETMNSISTERLYGLNWLCGYSDDWDRVPLET